MSYHPSHIPSVKLHTSTSSVSLQSPILNFHLTYVISSSISQSAHIPWFSPRTHLKHPSHLQGVPKKTSLLNFLFNTNSGQIWAFWANLGILGKSGHFGQIWHSGQFWAILGKSGHFGQIWAFAQNCPECPDLPRIAQNAQNAQNCPEFPKLTKMPRIAQNCPECPDLPRIAQNAQN